MPKGSTTLQLTTRMDRRDIERATGQVRFYIVTLDAALEKLASRYAIEMEREAKRLVPVDTGTLRDSIQGDVKRIVTRWVAEVRSNADGSAPYDRFVEFGTTLMEAQPFLRPTIQKFRAQWQQDVRNLKRRLKP
jgi:HK97 gp10 family phage protein